jgi:hypothetical protein
MENPKKLVEDVEQFIRDFDAANVIVLEKAENIDVFELGEGRFGKETKKRKGSLRSLIAKAIAEYRVNAPIPSLRWQFLRNCYYYIELARSNGVLEYPNLSAKAQKYDELEKEHEKLKSDHAKLMKMYNEVLREKDRLEKDNKILNAFDGKKNKHNDDGFIDGGGLTKP